jgi:4-amino-4-deoxy-L-arabinose transferase-like glycosyltransferase
VTDLAQRPKAVLFAVLAGILPLLGWWTYGLFDLDEGFYGAVTAEMNRRGEWITPLYNGHPWFEKPILLYWIAKPCLAIFGTAIGPRLPSVLATVSTYALVGWFAKRHFGTAAAVASVLVIASSLLVVAIGRMMLTDPLLLLSLTAATLTFWESLVSDPRWRLVAAFALGVGVLTKGPIACILFLALAALTFWREPELRPRFKGQWPLGLLILVLVVSAWYVPAYLIDGHEFVQKFLIEQNVGRFTGGDQAHTVRGVAGLLFYPIIILAGFLPWSFFLFPAWKSSPADDQAPLRRYLTTWFLVVLVFFTVAGAKLPSYVLPLAPSIALLVGSYLGIRWQARLEPKRLAGPVMWLVAVGAFAQWGFSRYYYGLHLGSLNLPGFHAEVQTLARYVRENASQTDQVAEFQMGRQQKSLGTGKPVIQETSHPSTLLYLNRDVLDTDDWSQILGASSKEWILTRWNRVTAADLEAAHGLVQPVQTPFPQDLYRLYVYNPQSRQ